MFSKTFVSAAVLALATSVSASPLASRQAAAAAAASAGSGSASAAASASASSLTPVSFDSWGGLSCLSGFDSFNGVDNFAGISTTQTVVQEVVCQSVDITVIQQQLAIVSEFAKRIVTTELCSVEAQTIVWSQFVAGFSSFSADIRRESSATIGFDSVIASHISDLVSESDVINTNDFGFTGSDIGSNLFSVTGSNWVDGVSESSVNAAFLASQVATIQSSASFTDSSTGSFGGLGGITNASPIVGL